MAKGCRMAIIRLSCVLKTFCAKIVDLRTMDDFKHDVALIVVLLKITFPIFFDTMTHLLVHLVEERKICGLVHTR
jgi:hypothetical protein